MKRISVSGSEAAQRPCAPSWVPDAALHYLAHTEQGVSIRALARAAGCHASTIMRQVRRIEQRRDDALTDAALRALAGGGSELPAEDALDREALRVLRRLCETGAVLAVAPGMEKAVVVRDVVGGGSMRTAVVDAGVAQALSLLEWIAVTGTGRIMRYQIAAAGRAALERLMQEGVDDGPAVNGMAEAPALFEGAEMAKVDAGGVETPARRARYALAESPLIALSRRRDSRGKPFLGAELVAAGERLREDFELGQMGAGEAGPASGTAERARARVAAALADLGPGLSDVVMRCCCYLEGLETTEKCLGWSARSGKIVLRIALLRLQRHYKQTAGPEGRLIG